ncbi:MAG: DUF116 domain-containing protein [Nitrospirae bacterium]|nr:DUF116 domain-containing protein [Nitrospirota bacterium]
MENISGKTYSLYGGRNRTDLYYSKIRELTDLLLMMSPDRHQLLTQIQKAGDKSFLKRAFDKDMDTQLILFIRKVLKDSLSVYTTGVKKHLKSVPLSQKFDPVINTEEEQYHLYMIEIELINRIFKEPFKKSGYKFALIAHCLKDFRHGCKSVPGDIESACKSCTKECLINLGGNLLKKYEIHPFISVTMKLKPLLRKIKSKHESVGALGIACLPELVQGMRQCIKAGIPPIGIPIDANRCARWMEKAHETSFSLKELENLIK